MGFPIYELYPNQNQPPPIHVNPQVQELQSYLDWQQAQIYYNQQIMNSNATMVGIINSQSRPIHSNAPASTRPSSSRRNIRTNIPIYQHRSITTDRRRRNLSTRALINLFNTQNELVRSLLESSGQFVNTMPNEGISMNLTGQLEVDHEAGLSEGEIMMSVERMTHCPSCFIRDLEGESCCICQEDYNQGEDICKLHNCNHIYHFDCIKTWLMQKNLCPICKTPAMYFDDIQMSNQTGLPQPAAP